MKKKSSEGLTGVASDGGLAEKLPEYVEAASVEKSDKVPGIDAKGVCSLADVISVLERLEKADTVYLPKDWVLSREKSLVYRAAKDYGKRIVEG